MSRQKHLLHIFPTFAVGGSQIRFGQLARLHGDRYRHTVIALSGDYGMAARLDGLNVVTHPLAFDKRNNFESWQVFRRVLKTLRPDVLLTYNWGSIEWALVNRFGPAIRHVHIEDGFGPEEAERQLRRRVWMRRLALSGKETDVVLPSRVLETIAKADWNVPPARRHYIPNGIDCARFAVPDRKPSLSQGEIVIGTVATLRAEKNIPRLIDAFAALAANRAEGALRLIVVGDGPQRAWLEQMAAARPAAKQIVFAGPSQRPEEWLRQMDIFALSSDTEQMPISVLEAMAAGLPIVSTRVGDVAQMVSPANESLVVPAGARYGEALAELVDDPARRLEIGRANAARALALFDERAMAARYAEIIG